MEEIIKRAIVQAYKDGTAKYGPEIHCPGDNIFHMINHFSAFWDLSISEEKNRYTDFSHYLFRRALDVYRTSDKITIEDLLLRAPYLAHSGSVQMMIAEMEPYEYSVN